MVCVCVCVCVLCVCVLCVCVCVCLCFPGCCYIRNFVFSCYNKGALLLMRNPYSFKLLNSTPVLGQVVTTARRCASGCRLIVRLLWDMSFVFPKHGGRLFRVFGFWRSLLIKFYGMVWCIKGLLHLWKLHLVWPMYLRIRT